MKHIITALVAIACIVAGGVAGHFLRSGSDAGQGAPAAEAAVAAEGAEDGHGAAGTPASSANASPGKAAPKASGRGTPATSYYRFSREFVVPLIENGRVSSLVILNINLEVDASISQALFSMEPALRDNIMTTLIALSNDGRTFEALNNIENYESMRAMILMNLKKISPTGINNVLILDMARQDV